MPEELDTLRQALAGSDIACAYLFGSRSTGQAGSRSDWDIAVLLAESPAGHTTWEKFRIEGGLTEALGTDGVQVVILNHLDDPLLAFEIISKGRLLVERDRTARLLFETAAVRSFQDWQYWLDRHLKAAATTAGDSGTAGQPQAP